MDKSAARLFNEEDIDAVPLLDSSDDIQRILPRKHYRSNRRRESSFFNFKRRNSLVCVMCLLFLFLTFMLYYQCPKNICRFHPSYLEDNTLSTPDSGITKQVHLPEESVKVNFVTYDDIHNENFQFNMNESDVMVFLHIQKTSGTHFGKRLVQDIDIDNPCQCHRRKKKGRRKNKNRKKGNKLHRPLSRVKRKNLSCVCLRPGTEKRKTWLFSRYSTGWKCGLHADWTELTECVDEYLDVSEGQALTGKRRYFYITFIREPISRFLSEFRHVGRGATWKGANNMCRGRPSTKEEIPPCYEGDDWSDVTLKEFIDCDSNLAFNRQTRMLANLRLVNCHNKTGMPVKERERIMLASAKQNLKRMAFFGLTESQEDSRRIFEDTFNLQFKEPFEQLEAGTDLDDFDPELLKEVKKLNYLDVELYAFAKNLFNERVEEINDDLDEDDSVERNEVN